ncbi:unnamed protein product, partial [Adineta steineri]
MAANTSSNASMADTDSVYRRQSSSTIVSHQYSTTNASINKSNTSDGVLQTDE